MDDAIRRIDDMIHKIEYIKDKQKENAIPKFRKNIDIRYFFC